MLLLLSLSVAYEWLNQWILFSEKKKKKNILERSESEGEAEGENMRVETEYFHV